MAINLICVDGVKNIDVSNITYQPSPKREKPIRSSGSSDALFLLMRYLDLSFEEATKKCEFYGYYGGAIAYLLQQLGMTHDEAYEKGIVPYPKPVDQCDEEHRLILEEYRRIRLEKGIKEANKYFLEKNTVVYHGRGGR